MKATEARLLDFLMKPSRFIIPIYQRTYSWTEPECQQLWNDILRTGQNEDISAHFVGSIVYIEKGLYQVTGLSPLLVIDGQQRLTTVSLILESLARELGNAEPIEGFSAKKIRDYYLLNPNEDGESRYKLLLTQTDKESLLALVNQKPWPFEHSMRLKKNYEFFENKVKKLNGELASLCKGLAKLIIVDIALSRDQDKPQLIFESMNSTGRELSQADLIRNFILMGLESTHQSQLYNDYWRRMEMSFGQEAYGAQFDGFMRHYLTLKTGEIPNVRKVYEAFKEYAHSPKVAAAGVDALLADIQSFSEYYCAMALVGAESNELLAAVFRDLRELKVDVAYPFLLYLYHDYSKGLLSVEHLEYAARLVESYVFRRAVCAIPTNSLNKTFATFASALNKDRYLESIKAYYLLLPSYRRFPDDAEFQREIKVRNLYNFRSRIYWLRRLENHDRKEKVVVDEYTIEHILPQNENLSKQWQDALGPEWKQVQVKWLHTLGNLTLTGYNAEYSDHPFTNKRDMKGGFGESPLRVNEDLGVLDIWDESAIQTRASRLAEKTVQVWVSPTLPDEVLETYRPNVKNPTDYSLDDHKYLTEGSPMRPLFEMFRKEVLAFDPCVSEGVLKNYVAYRAETQFVRVNPRAKQLRLFLRMEFHELHDQKELAKDVSNPDRWGRVEVSLTSLEQLPYVIGLVRQAFEKQMGNGEMDT